MRLDLSLGRGQLEDIGNGGVGGGQQRGSSDGGGVTPSGSHSGFDAIQW